MKKSNAAASPSPLPHDGAVVVHAERGIKKKRRRDESAEDTVRRRRQYKLYQRRHRAKQSAAIQLLKDQAANLRGEISCLEQLHASLEPLHVDQALSLRGTLAGSPAQLARAYMDHFKHGFGSHKAASDSQETFVRTAMAPDVRGTHFHGIDEFLLQWSLYSQFFSSIELAAKSYDVETVTDTTLVVVHVQLSLHIRSKEIDALFPNVAGDEDVRSVLESSVIIVDGALTFVVGRDMRIGWLGSRMDFAGGLTRVLGSVTEMQRCVEGTELSLSTGVIRHCVVASPSVHASASTGGQYEVSSSRHCLSRILCEASDARKL